MIKFVHKGNFEQTNRFLRLAKKINLMAVLNKYGEIGVQALASSTPVGSGKTAESWKYELHGGLQNPSIIWFNTNVNKGVNIALILHYGHGTGTGGYVEGRNYITPAIRPIFDKIAEDAWREVTSL